MLKALTRGALRSFGWTAPPIFWNLLFPNHSPAMVLTLRSRRERKRTFIVPYDVTIGAASTKESSMTIAFATVAAKETQAYRTEEATLTDTTTNVTFASVWRES